MASASSPGSVPRVCIVTTSPDASCGIATWARSTSATRVTAMLVRGEDRFGNFDDERRPVVEAGPEERAFHERAVALFRQANVEQTENTAIIKH